MVANELKKDLESCVGLLCEVLTEDNSLLYIGLVSDYQHHQAEMQIHVHKGDRPPAGVIYNTPVRVRVRPAGAEGHLMMIYGSVLRCAPKFWRIGLEHAVVCRENRGSFRQRLTGEALVTPQPAKITESSENIAEPDPLPCELIDISLSGICFRTRGVYEAGGHLTVSSVQVVKDGQHYTFHCFVRRVQRDQKNASWSIYGCSFLGLSAQEEIRLSKDIFKLQADTYRSTTKSREDPWP